MKMIVMVAMFAVALTAIAMPAVAADDAEVMALDAGNTECIPCETCCEKCGCSGGKSLGDLLLVGVAMMGLATLSATRK